MDIDDIINNIQDDRRRLQDSEDETASDDARLLKQAWIKERTCPELLTFEETLLDRVMMRVREQVNFCHQFYAPNDLLTYNLDGIYRRKHAGASAGTRHQSQAANSRI